MKDSEPEIFNELADPFEGAAVIISAILTAIVIGAILSIGYFCSR